MVASSGSLLRDLSQTNDRRTYILNPSDKNRDLVLAVDILLKGIKSCTLDLWTYLFHDCILGKLNKD